MALEHVNKTQQERIIRKSELSRMLGLSHPTIWRKVKDGELPAPIRLGKILSAGNFLRLTHGWIAVNVLRRLNNGKPH